jgi:hypothetical protein
MEGPPARRPFLFSAGREGKHSAVCSRRAERPVLEWRQVVGLNLMFTRAAYLAAGLLGLAGCSDEPTSGQTQRLQAQVQEFSQQVR